MMRENFWRVVASWAEAGQQWRLREAGGMNSARAKRVGLRTRISHTSESGHSCAVQYFGIGRSCFNSRINL